MKGNEGQPCIPRNKNFLNRNPSSRGFPLVSLENIYCYFRLQEGSAQASASMRASLMNNPRDVKS